MAMLLRSLSIGSFAFPMTTVPGPATWAFVVAVVLTLAFTLACVWAAAKVPDRHPRAGPGPLVPEAAGLGLFVIV